MKKIVVLLLVTLFAVQVPAAMPAEIPPSIAVIDVGTNSSLYKDVILVKLVNI